MDDAIEVERKKIWEEYEKDLLEHEEEYAESAKQERIESLKRNWERVRKQCTDDQIKAIQHFVQWGSYSVPAAMVHMSVPDFMAFLDELGIARCI